MPPKLPACDPCRSRKVACDHKRPVCTRCEEADLVDRCEYRSRPFKKKKHAGHDSSNRREQNLVLQAPPTSASLEKLSQKTREYPNPGFLGPSSYTSFFDDLQPPDHAGRNSDKDVVAQPKMTINAEKIMQGASLVEQIRSSANILLCTSLVEAWTSKGTNLALAHAFIPSCAASAKYILKKVDKAEHTPENISEKLFTNSCRALDLHASSTLADLSAMFSMDKARWETLGLFFTAVSRTTVDHEVSQANYSSSKQRRDLQRVAMHCSDSCLEIALSLDCLNDLQLMLQYENFILHSLVDGDQSYNSWRKLGDVISSLFALGYHESLGKEAISPVCLQDLRREALLRAYSADKNVSIFLGRPPRVMRNYCLAIQQQSPWTSDSFERQTETKWSAICAVLKERALEVREESHATKSITASLIQTDAEEQWNLLPHKLHLEQPLLTYDRKPVELDFMVSARLNYLHVMLLLQLALDAKAQPGPRLRRTAAEMLDTTVGAIVARHCLANSGTSLVWKVAYYGLSAAGVVCIALLRSSIREDDPGSSPAGMIRNLSVLAAEIEGGALAHHEDPNYALLTGAARAINNLLDRLTRKKFTTNEVDVNSSLSEVELPMASANDDFWNIDQWQDFDPDFWSNLAGHPFLNIATEAHDERL